MRSLFFFILAILSNLAAAQYKITCNVASGCPEAVGLIRIGEGSTLSRCTGFLIASDLVMTGGHCLDLATGQTADFITRSDVPGVSPQTRKLVSTVYRDLTANVRNPEKLSGWPDAAVYKLEKPILTLHTLKLARGMPRAFTTLKAFVVEQKVSEALTIEPIDCQVHRHERLFPYDILAAPDVLRLFACQGEAGFSGAPLLAPGGNEVEALMNGPKDPPQNAMPFPYQPSVEVTNVRCLNYAGSPPMACFHPQDQDMQNHFQQIEMTAVNSLQTRQPFPQTVPFEFTRYIYPTVDAYTYHVAFYPHCRRPNWDLRTLSLPVESMRMEFDLWARPKFTVQGVESAVGQVTARTGDAFQVQMRWTPLGQELSRQLGSTFSIALPLCAR